MIHLSSVTKFVTSRHHGPALGLHRTTIVVPTDRRVAILGGRRKGKTTLLRLIASMEAPDEGEVLVGEPLSPIANSRSLLHPRMTCAENIAVLARVMGVDAGRMAAAVSALCRFDDDIEKPVVVLSFARRQELELALLSILTFSCYLLDDAHLTPKSLLERYFDAARKRGAGIIFTTAQPKQVHEYADCAIVVRNHTARIFNHLEEAIQAYEQ
jgi:capsular polysaccharide transport system ATP-binding protein